MWDYHCADSHRPAEGPHAGALALSSGREEEAGGDPQRAVWGGGCRCMPALGSVLSHSQREDPCALLLLLPLFCVWVSKKDQPATALGAFGGGPTTYLSHADLLLHVAVGCGWVYQGTPGGPQLSGSAAGQGGRCEWRFWSLPTQVGVRLLPFRV